MQTEIIEQDQTIEMDFMPAKIEAVEHEVQQGSDEWLDLRIGVLSASKVDGIVKNEKIEVDDFENLYVRGPKKGQPKKKTESRLAVSEAWIKTMAKTLLAELNEVDEPNFSTWAMERGNSLEVEAREMMALIFGNKVRQAGFFLNQTLNIGCSPDGIIMGQKTGLEIKCPLAKKHIDNLVAGVVPSEYYSQVQFSMFVTGYPEWYFCSYYPGMKPLVIRVERDEELHCLFLEAIGKLKETIGEYRLIIGS